MNLEESLNSITSSLNKKYKRTNKNDDDVIVDPEETRSSIVDRISTGFVTLDSITGGGIPVGRIIEIYGQESSGKTTIAMNIAKQALAKDKNYAVFIFETEEANDKKRLEEMGLDLKRVRFSYPNSIEQLWEYFKDFVDMFYNKIPDGKLLVIWDSVAATPSEAELKADEDKADMGTAAKAISRGLKKYNSYCTKNGLTFVIINQIRDAVGVMYGSKVTTPGGKAIKFYSSLRIEVKPKEVIKDGNTPIGLKVKAKTVKNKTYIPYLESDIFIDFENGLTFDNPQALLDALIEIEELIPVRNKNGNLSGKYFLKSGDEEDAKTLKVWKELIEENEEVKEALLTISRGEGELI